MKPQRIKIRNFKVMFIIEELFEEIIREINLMMFKEMKIRVNNKTKEFKMIQFKTKRLKGRNKLEFLKLIHLDCFMSEIDMCS